MTRHIHDAHFFAVWKGHPAEAKLNRHLAGLFFLETVRMSAGQCCDEGGLAMINVTSCADNAHMNQCSKNERCPQDPLQGTALEVHKRRGYRFLLLFTFLPCPMIRS